MNVLVDTSVWSLVLGRNKSQQKHEETRQVLKDLIQEFRVQIIGPIRQELLSGITNNNQFQKLREILQSFEDLSLNTSDYERAAEMFNICRKKGIQGSHVDFVICAAAERYQLSIYTLDADFQHYSKHLPIHLFQIS